MSNYYDMGSSYGKPTPLVLLPFAEMLAAKTDNALLWWVGARARGWGQARGVKAVDRAAGGLASHAE